MKPKVKYTIRNTPGRQRVLDFINLARVGLGRPVIESLPLGICDDPEESVLARALGPGIEVEACKVFLECKHQAKNLAWVWGTVLQRCADGDWYYVLLPEPLAQFDAAFNCGLFVDLIEPGADDPSWWTSDLSEIVDAYLSEAGLAYDGVIVDGLESISPLPLPEVEA